MLGRMARQNLQHPTNLLGLAAELAAAGHDPRLLDLEVVPDPREALARALDEHRPAVVGLSVVTPHVPGAADIARQARLADPHVFLIAGGPHATALPDDLLDEIPSLDAVCVGEGDQTFPAVCDALQRVGVADPARETALAGIPGLVLREHGATGARDPLPDLDSLAPIDRSLLDWSAYEGLAGHKGVAGPTPCGGSARGPASAAARWPACSRRSTA